MLSARREDCDLSLPAAVRARLGTDRSLVGLMRGGIRHCVPILSGVFCLLPDNEVACGRDITDHDREGFPVAQVLTHLRCPPA